MSAPTPPPDPKPAPHPGEPLPPTRPEPAPEPKPTWPKVDADDNWSYLEYDEASEEPVGSCDWCGSNLYEDDDDELCEQCLWAAMQGHA